MRAICKQAKPDDSWLPKHREIYSRFVHSDEVFLTVGQSYVVYGVYFWGGLPWYLVCEEPTDTYPVPKCGLLFDLVDPTIPHDWQLRARRDGEAVVLLPKAWAEDATLMERLLNGHPHAEAMFRELREQYEREFGD